MRAPKILPWVAKKSGISEELALKLWRRAAGEAEVLAGNCTTSDYFQLAVERYLSLAEEESGHSADHSGTPDFMGWAWQHHRRMSHMSMIAAENACRQWQSAWQDYYRGRKAA